MSTLTIPHGCRFRRSRPTISLRSKTLFLALCFVTIAAISSIDIWFAVANSSILVVEQNPVCKALMQLEPDGFTYFILAKATGTLMVILTLLALHAKKFRHAMTITLAIVIFQLGLLTYLTLSDPLTGNLPNLELLLGDTPESIWSIR